MVQHIFTGYQQQIGVEFGASLISLPNGKTIKAQVWDTAGYGMIRDESHFQL
jgi:GTPase SAR1 family protein